MMPRHKYPQYRIKDGEKILTVGGNQVNTKREFILDYLNQRGEDGAYVMEMLRGWKTLCKEVGKDPGTYETFRQAVYQAKLDGLIEPYRREKGLHNYPRTYYRIKKY